MGQGSQTINGYRWLHTLLCAADPAWRSQQLLEAIALHPYTLLDPEVTPSVPTTSNTAKWAQPCKAPRRGGIAHAWLSVICGGTSGRRVLVEPPRRPTRLRLSEAVCKVEPRWVGTSQ